MARYIKAVRLPSGDLVSIDAIGTVKRFDAGVGILDLRNRMVGWVEISEEDPKARDEHFNYVLDVFDQLINDQRRAYQPDWGCLVRSQ